MRIRQQVKKRNRLRFKAFKLEPIAWVEEMTSHAAPKLPWWLETKREKGQGRVAMSAARAPRHWKVEGEACLGSGEVLVVAWPHRQAWGLCEDKADRGRCMPLLCA